MEQGSLIDLDEQPTALSTHQQSAETTMELSLSGHAPAGQSAGQGTVTADSNSNKDDPFPGFEALASQHRPDATEAISTTTQQAASAHQEQQQQPGSSPAQQELQHEAAQGTSSDACLKAAAERAARTSDVLQQHSIEQGESNAKLR